MKPILSAAVVIVLLSPPGFANEPDYTLRDLDGAECFS